jgi:energy-coupling factor transporter ATP-binding protein EcfA2
MTKWWKCDLQVATPAWRFEVPADGGFDMSSAEGMDRFADRYMQSLSDQAVEVVALADHNTHTWIDRMVAAGQRNGVVVFPGCEITTGSGADGIHLVVIGNRTSTSRDFDLLLAGSLGYSDASHPRFHPVGGRQEPGSSAKTVVQILDDLPDDYLVFAPHALNDNGIASCSTVRGDIRWRAIHHHHLNALDPGDCSGAIEDSFNGRFRRRELDDFPRLRDLAFISTSDAYALSDLGSRFTWIRMEEPTLEGLRQAFLDPEARIICSWDSRLDRFPDRNPNQVRHAWIEAVNLEGELGNSSSPIRVSFDPHLNVVIGGRGSGKSTVVAAIRELYSGFNTLPNGIRDEAQQFSQEIFAAAMLSASHRLPNSQESQVAQWTAGSGSLTYREGLEPVPTAFRVRVVNQKELFARVSLDRRDHFAASRSLLSFVDESLGLLRLDPLPPDSWWRTFDQACASWMTNARAAKALASDIAQMPTIQARVRDVAAQVAAFDSPEAKDRRARNEELLRQASELESGEESVRGLASRAQELADEFEDPPSLTDTPAAGIGADLNAIATGLRQQLSSLSADTLRDLVAWRVRADASEWMASVRIAESDEEAYLAELESKGIDPDAYGDLRRQLADLQVLEASLRSKETELAAAVAQKAAAWTLVVASLEERRLRRNQLLANVAAKSGRLRFRLKPHADTSGWGKSVRDLLNLRADAFLGDVPRVADWLWNGERTPAAAERWVQWREALASGSLEPVGSTNRAVFRPDWQRRLESLDEAIRLRLAVEAADDVLEMEFLKDDGDPLCDQDWQAVSQGSAGQRSAAMLAFVLHHGSEPLVLDQPEDDLDTEWISNLVVRELRASRSTRQVIVATHNANIPVNGDAERVIVLENSAGELRIRSTEVAGAEPLLHSGAIELQPVREDIQNIMEGGIRAFVQREKKYNNELRAVASDYLPEPGLAT